MGKGIAKLLSISSDPLGPRPAAKPPALLEQAGTEGHELFRLLTARNGFYTFESALHVLPLGNSGAQSVENWNSQKLWRDRYRDLAEGCLFFAEDLFGGQFCIKDGRIQSFDPETGALEQVAGTVEAWVRMLLHDYAVLTGQPLAHAWQTQHGVLPEGQRLLPKIPFVAGGAFEVENLYAEDAVKGMQFRGDMALQLRDLPDGAELVIKVVD